MNNILQLVFPLEYTVHVIVLKQVHIMLESLEPAFILM